MKTLRRFLRNEDGIAMATAVGMTVVLTILSVVLIDQVTDESSRAAKSVTSDAVFQAAEAGINDYIAKLTDDPQYYDHCVAKGESTRRTESGTLVAHSVDTASCQPGGASAWTSGLRWTYPSGKDWWTAGIGDSSTNTTAVHGYAYNLTITPPYAPVGANPGTNYINVVSTGCKVVDPTATPLQCDANVPRRTIEVYVRRTTPADFQFMMTNMGHGSSDVCWASTIYGKMYSTGDIYVCGATFYGNVMAEDLVRVKSGSPNPPNVVSPGRIYDDNHPDIRTVLKNPLSFSDLLASVSQVQSNAALNTNLRAGSASTGYGTAFDDATASAWRLNFSSNGNFQAWKCVNSSAPEATQPFCGPDALLNMTSLPKYSSTSTFTLNVVSGGTSAFPSSGTVYVGPNSSSRIDTVTYSSVDSDSFNGARCTTCTSSAQTHQLNEHVSMIPSGGITWPVPYYNGPLPPNGAIYTGQDAIISWPSAIAGFNETSSTGAQTSKVNGRVTVASNQDVVVAGNVHYASETPQNGIGGDNDDVLGLIAQGSVWLARYAPNVLWWRAATMAVDGSWGDYACKNGPDRGSNSYMTFVGTSTYGSNAGCIHSSGGYEIDHTYRITDDGTAPACPSTAPGCQSFDALRWLIPAWFPPLNGIETVLFREMQADYSPAPVPTS